MEMVALSYNIHFEESLTFENRIFIIEGILTVVVGFAARFWVCDWPETAKFLTEEERVILTTRLQVDSGEAVMNRLDKAASTCLLFCISSKVRWKLIKLQTSPPHLHRLEDLLRCGHVHGNRQHRLLRLLLRPNDHS
jgi:hypothetical protein